MPCVRMEIAPCSDNTMSTLQIPNRPQAVCRHNVYTKPAVNGPHDLVTAPHNQIVTLTQNSLGLEERVLAFTKRSL